MGKVNLDPAESLKISNMQKVVFSPSTALIWELSLIRRYQTLASNPLKKRGFDSRLVINKTAILAEWKNLAETFPNKEAALIVLGVNRNNRETLLHVYRIDTSVLGWVKTNRKALFQLFLAHFEAQCFKAIRFQIAYPQQAAA